MTTQQQTANNLLARAKQNRKSAWHRFFLIDLYLRLQDTSLYVHWQRILTALRRLRAVTLTFRILSLFFAVLQTGTFVLLSATLLLAVLPILLIGTLTILLSAVFTSRRANRRLSERLLGKRIYVIFPDTLSSSFLVQHTKDLCARGYAVILVSPYLFSPAGIRYNRFYTTVREEYDCIFLVRRYYYFSLKRRLLAHMDTIYQF